MINSDKEIHSGFSTFQQSAQLAPRCDMELHEFMGLLDPPFTGEELFDHLTDTVFFIKNREGKYLSVNQTLVSRCGVQEKQELVGRAASEVWPQPMGSRYTAQDIDVIKTGIPLLSKLELHMFANRKSGWCLTTKIPLRQRKKGPPIGLVGMSRDLAIPDLETEAYRRVSKAIEYGQENISKPIGVGELSKVANLSRYQLDRRMKLVFGLTSGQWLSKMRIDFAQRRLMESQDTISQIAIDSGYSDQSAFSRQFRKATGLTPREFRNAASRPFIT